MSKSAANIVLSIKEWNPSDVKYMAPKVNERGGKAINLISTQTNRSLHLSTPLMMTWGISDWTDEKTGESNGSFKMSLNFPNEDYKTDATTEFLNKLKTFENQILDDAVKNSELWFGEQMSRDVAKHTFFPFLKYPKDKTTKKIDLTKGPSISPKVPNYNDKWAVEIYDANRKILFPNENGLLTPMDFVPPRSKVACVLQCGGIWFGGKGWGLTWKLNQCVVKPQEVISVFGQCRIPDDICSSVENQELKSSADQDDEPASTKQSSTMVDDSDDEAADDEVELASVPEPEEAKVVKKIVKKIVAQEVATEVAAVVAAAAPVESEAKVVKKVIKKKL